MWRGPVGDGANLTLVLRVILLLFLCFSSDCSNVLKVAETLTLFCNEDRPFTICEEIFLSAGSIGGNMLSGKIPFYRSENLGNRGRDRMRSCAAWYPAQPQYGCGASKETFGRTLDPNRRSGNLLPTAERQITLQNQRCCHSIHSIFTLFAMIVML